MGTCFLVEDSGLKIHSRYGGESLQFHYGKGPWLGPEGCVGKVVQDVLATLFESSNRKVVQPLTVLFG